MAAGTSGQPDHPTTSRRTPVSCAIQWGPARTCRKRHLWVERIPRSFGKHVRTVVYELATLVSCRDCEQEVKGTYSRVGKTDGARRRRHI